MLPELEVLFQLEQNADYVHHQNVLVLVLLGVVGEAQNLVPAVDYAHHQNVLVLVLLMVVEEAQNLVPAVDYVHHQNVLVPTEQAEEEYSLFHYSLEGEPIVIQNLDVLEDQRLPLE